MKPSITYGLLNALLGLIVGIILTVGAIGGGYGAFIIAAPIAAFLTSWLFWKIIIKEDKNTSVGRVIFTGILSGSLSHYITFLVLSIIMSICYWTTGGCTGSLGDAPANPLEMLVYGWGYVFFSLLIFGWLTIGYAILMGFLLRKKIL